MLRFIKDWMLAFAIVIGAAAYLIYVNLPLFDPLRPYAMPTVQVVQPTLLFLMLFLSFLKVDPHELHFRRWHLWLILFQATTFVALAAALYSITSLSGIAKVVIQSAMICLICPTATAAAVVTERLGGSVAQTVTYTILVNIVVALLVPLVVPLIHVGTAHYGFLTMFVMILSRVLPMLVLPLLLAWLVRYATPRLHALLLRPRSLAFYMWCVGLALAIAVTTRSLMRSHYGWQAAASIAVVSMLCCMLQFWFGKHIGKRYQPTAVTALTAGQALGQKNTIFIIWLAYTFFDPITSLAGGFYSIWHNVYNSYQLAHKK